MTDVLTHSGGPALTISGRTYGESGQKDHFASLRTMPVPVEMNALTESLHRQSKLLALPTDSKPEAIHSAYGADLGLLTRHREAFRATIEAAVFARADDRHEDAKTFLKSLAGQIGEINHAPKLDLGPEVLKLEPPMRLARLQEEFRLDAEDLKAAIAIWMHSLVETETVCAIEWLDGGKTVARYHFFRMESERKSTEQRHDPGMHAVGRTVKITTKSDITIFAERRTHTLVNVKSHPVESYQRRVPQRIARLIDEIPAEVRPFVTIVDGQVTKEEVARNVAGQRSETVERSVWVKDPAPALFGTWAIAGWGGTSDEVASSVFTGHPLQSADRWLVGSAIATAALTAAAIPFGGGRGALLMLLCCAILTGFHQLSMRLGSRS